MTTLSHGRSCSKHNAPEGYSRKKRFFIKDHRGPGMHDVLQNQSSMKTAFYQRSVKFDHVVFQKHGIFYFSGRNFSSQHFDLFGFGYDLDMETKNSGLTSRPKNWEWVFKKKIINPRYIPGMKGLDSIVKKNKILSNNIWTSIDLTFKVIKIRSLENWFSVCYDDIINKNLFLYYS